MAANRKFQSRLLASLRLSAYRTEDGEERPKRTARRRPAIRSGEESVLRSTALLRRGFISADFYLHALLQAGFDEHIQIAVEHLLRVGDLDIGAQILDAGIVQHVAADLVAPADVGLAGF